MKIFLIGFMGCGKSHWGQRLGERLGIPFFDLDKAVEEQEGMSISDLFAKEGEEHFRGLEKEVLQQLTTANETFVMATGGGTPCFFNNIDYLKNNGTVVWLNCSIDAIYQRLLKERDQRPLLRNIADEELKAYIAKKYAGRKIYYGQAGIILPEEQLQLDAMIHQIFHANG